MPYTEIVKSGTNGLAWCCRTCLLSDWSQLGVAELAGELGVSHPLAPPPVVSMLLGEWSSLLEGGRRLEEVNNKILKLTVEAVDFHKLSSCIWLF